MSKLAKTNQPQIMIMGIETETHLFVGKFLKIDVRSNLFGGVTGNFEDETFAECKADGTVSKVEISNITQSINDLDFTKPIYSEGEHRGYLTWKKDGKPTSQSIVRFFICYASVANEFEEKFVGMKLKNQKILEGSDAEEIDQAK